MNFGYKELKCTLEGVKGQQLPEDMDPTDMIVALEAFSQADLDMITYVNSNASLELMEIRLDAAQKTIEKHGVDPTLIHYLSENMQLPGISTEGFVDTAKEVYIKIRDYILGLIKKIYNWIREHFNINIYYLVNLKKKLESLRPVYDPPATGAKFEYDVDKFNNTKVSGVATPVQLVGTRPGEITPVTIISDCFTELKRRKTVDELYNQFSGGDPNSKHKVWTEKYGIASGLTPVIQVLSTNPQEETLGAKGWNCNDIIDLCRIFVGVDIARAKIRIYSSVAPVSDLSEFTNTVAHVQKTVIKPELENCARQYDALAKSKLSESHLEHAKSAAEQLRARGVALTIFLNELAKLHLLTMMQITKIINPVMVKAI